MYTNEQLYAWIQVESRQAEQANGAKTSSAFWSRQHESTGKSKKLQVSWKWEKYFLTSKSPSFSISFAHWNPDWTNETLAAYLQIHRKLSQLNLLCPSGQRGGGGEVVLCNGQVCELNVLPPHPWQWNSPNGWHCELPWSFADNLWLMILTCRQISGLIPRQISSKQTTNIRLTTHKYCPTNICQSWPGPPALTNFPSLP